MPNMEDMWDDPEPSDENDPEVMEEMFELHKHLGSKPEDLKGATAVYRSQYAEWLTHGSDGEGPLRSTDSALDQNTVANNVPGESPKVINDVEIVMPLQRPSPPVDEETPSTGSSGLPSRAELEKKANEGNASAARSLGDLYRTGSGVKQNWTKAFRWYTRGALLGDEVAQNNLGTMLLSGIGCKLDKAQAVVWFRRSAEQGCSDAQWNLAKRYLHGDGVGQDFDEAYQWFSKASAQGNIEALCEMGTMHRFGQGVERSLLAAADLNLKAAEAGDPVAIGNIADYLSELKSMALSGSESASLFLSKFYNRGLGVDPSLPLTWTWISWARTLCSRTESSQVHAEVKATYDFFEKCITSSDRDEGERALIALRSAWSDENTCLSTLKACPRRLA